MEFTIRESLSVEEDSITNKFQLVLYDPPPKSGLDEISLSGTDKLVSSFRVSGSSVEERERQMDQKIKFAFTFPNHCNPISIGVRFPKSVGQMNMPFNLLCSVLRKYVWIICLRFLFWQRL